MKKIIKSMILMAGLAVAMPVITYAQVSVGVGLYANIAPPEIPVYEQPECPGDGYLWTPGYWNYDDGYYWVPGVWVMPPSVGVYWTPSYWGFEGGRYGFHGGYWGPHVGFYGGINYGFGYGGNGYYGGVWSGRRFRYNTAVTRVNIRIVHNTYVNNHFARNNNRFGYNGPGGANARPNRQEQLAARDRHINATRNQLANQRSARNNKNQFAKNNHGKPAIASRNKVNGRGFNQQGRVAKNTAAAHRATAQKNAVAKRNVAKRANGVAQRKVQNQQKRTANRQATQARNQQKRAANRPATQVRNQQRTANRQATQARNQQRRTANQARNQQQRTANRQVRANNQAQRAANRPQRANRPQQQRAQNHPQNNPRQHK